jgi:hypothetical protein
VKQESVPGGGELKRLETEVLSCHVALVWLTDGLSATRGVSRYWKSLAELRALPHSSHICLGGA